MPQTVAVLGASDNPERYSNKAIKMLLKHGHNVIPINPRGHQIESIRCRKSLEDLTAEGLKVDTLTLYVGPQISQNLSEGIISLKPRRVIFNPGTENSELAAELQKAGVETLDACTLVLLSTDSF